MLTHTILQSTTDPAQRSEVIRRNDDAIFELHLALAEVELVGPTNIVELVDSTQARVADNPFESNQPDWDALIDAMRADIGSKD